MERRNATGKWPLQTDLYKEFSDFNELYYFNSPTLTPATGGTGNTITVTITPNKANFDVPEDYTGDLELYIDWENGENSGWAGDIRNDYASHLPQAKRS